MYQVQLFATTSADWAAGVELIDNDTNLPLAGIEDATFELEVDDRDGDTILNASTDLGTITRPATNVVQWIFPASDLGRCRNGATYRVGLTMTTSAGTIQLFTGTLVFVDGIVR
jgi:hypothetical protein